MDIIELLKDKEISSDIMDIIAEYNNDNNDRLLRCNADIQNIKKRHQKELSGIREKTIDEVVSNLIDTLNILSKIEETGVKLIYNNLSKTLQEKYSLEMIAVSPGDKFDADIHEAISVVDNSGESGSVSSVVSNGYRRGDKIIEYVKVIVVK